jgi:hypothetical protein
MKKICLLVFLSGIVSLSMAQSPKFSLIAGINESSFNLSNPNTFTANGYDKSSTSTVSGFQIGALVSFDINRFTIQPGLIYTTKGSNIADLFYQQTTTTNSSITQNEQKQTLNYLEIPVNILYNFPVKKVGKFFIGGGPYLAYGLSGKGNGSTSTTVNNGTSSTYSTTVFNGNINFGSGGNEVKNPDIGINTLLGLDLKNRIRISAGYGFGLSSLSNQSNNKYTNAVISFSLGYTFL